MIFLHRIRFLTLAFLLGLCAPLAVMGQSPSLSISPAGIYQNDCYTITVGGGAGMTIDILYSLLSG